MQVFRQTQLGSGETHPPNSTATWAAAPASRQNMIRERIYIAPLSPSIKLSCSCFFCGGEKGAEEPWDEAACFSSTLAHPPQLQEEKLRFKSPPTLETVVRTRNCRYFSSLGGALGDGTLKPVHCFQQKIFIHPVKTPPKHLCSPSQGRPGKQSTIQLKWA